MALNELVAATVAFVAALLPEEEAFELFFFDSFQISAAAQASVRRSLPV